MLGLSELSLWLSCGSEKSCNVSLTNSRRKLCSGNNWCVILFFLVLVVVVVVVVGSSSSSSSSSSSIVVSSSSHNGPSKVGFCMKISRSSSKPRLFADCACIFNDPILPHITHRATHVYFENLDWDAAVPYCSGEHSLFSSNSQSLPRLGSSLSYV